MKGKVIFITGASRGIGKAIALRCAMEGARITVASKSSDTSRSKLDGTIEQTAKEIHQLGGEALACQCDIRYEDQLQSAINATVAKFGGIDVVINNASAISLTDTPNTPVKKYDLMNSINGRGTWLLSKLSLPHLIKSAKLKRNPQILTLSPPMSLDAAWFENHTAYTIAKFTMSMCTLGMAAEFKKYGIHVNSLWPRTAIDTDAMMLIPGASDSKSKLRSVGIMADAAFVILQQNELTGTFAIDDDLLYSQGFNRKDLDVYANTPGMKDEDFFPDFFIPEGYKTTLPNMKKVLSKLNQLAKL